LSNKQMSFVQETLTSYQLIAAIEKMGQDYNNMNAAVK
jgi:hypothetical protein